MKGIFTIWLFLLLTLKIAYSQPTSTKILIDPENLHGGLVSEVFSGVSYIPLENAKSFQLDDINSIKVGDTTIYLLDRRKQQILIFTTHGKFKTKIDECPVLEFKKVWNGFSEISYDEQTNTLHVIGSILGKGSIILAYDQDGKYTNKYKIVPSIFFSIIDWNNIVEFNSYKTENVMKRKKSHKPPQDHVIFWNKENPQKTYLPIDQSILFKGSDDFLDYAFGHDLDSDNTLFSKAGSYSIYALNKDSISAIYEILFPLTYSLPRDLISAKINEGKRFNELVDRPNMYYWLSLSPIFKFSSNLFFSPKSKSSSEHIMYDLNKEKAYSLKRISSELGNLPICGRKGILAIKNGKAYSFISANDFLQSAPEDKSILPMHLQEFTAQNNHLLNPVLIVLDLKKHD